MTTQNYDLVILGGGTGGYMAAIRAAQAGKTVAIVEKEKLGGTCLHKGCIPSKSLLRSAEVYATLKEGAYYGVMSESIALDYARVTERKLEIVEQLHQGVQLLMQKHKIDVYYGNGRIIGPSIFSPRSGAVAIETENDDAPTLLSRNTIIATGSRPRAIPGLAFDGKRIMSSDDALLMEQLPSSIIIIGGGVIGVEWASMLNDFGVDVTILETASRVLPHEDQHISEEILRQFKRREIKVLTGVTVDPEGVQAGDEEVSMLFQHEGAALPLSAQCCLVSIGRQANTEGIGLENTDIVVKDGAISVNSSLQTNEPHIYAIGDVIGGLQLAHKAGHDALLAVDHMLGREVSPASRERIPRCIYSRPEVAAIGLTEREAKERGYELKIGRIPFKAIAKAQVYGDTDGFVKVIADAKQDDILGVHIIGPQATELISEAGLAQIVEATPWETASAIRPHPSLSEAITEAMLAVDKKAIGI